MANVGPERLVSFSFSPTCLTCSCVVGASPHAPPGPRPSAPPTHNALSLPARLPAALPGPVPVPCVCPVAHASPPTRPHLLFFSARPPACSIYASFYLDLRSNLPLVHRPPSLPAEVPDKSTTHPQPPPRPPRRLASISSYLIHPTHSGPVASGVLSDVGHYINLTRPRSPQACVPNHIYFHRSYFGPERPRGGATLQSENGVPDKIFFGIAPAMSHHVPV
jgi:hypothetical protein